MKWKEDLYIVLILGAVFVIGIVVGKDIQERSNKEIITTYEKLLSIDPVQFTTETFDER